MIEILQTSIIDKKTDERIEGIVGNNFSSYVRDYDFSVLLLDHNKGRAGFSLPEGFGDLHGNIFKHFVNSAEYKANFKNHRSFALASPAKTPITRPEINILSRGSNTGQRVHR